ncbi:MAG: LysM peptidoglycan-binding domain-containing protein [Flavobacteriales bacterium]|nr:LysM peptidoglycan-binding domain-containing protein [Flavobacteriales bacterium]
MARTLLLLPALALSLGLSAQDGPTPVVPANDPVLEQLDELSLLPWLKNDPFTTDAGALNVHGFAPTDTPSYTPEVYRRRLAVLDERTPFKLTYNEQVQAYIDLYARRKREQTSRMLGLAQLYFPVFEEALDRHGMPLELKYLAVVESALYPGARSRAAAVGLWQFMIGTGKLYGLEVDSYVDERCDVYQSTDAACRYLKDLYRIFGNWELALAAYNCGPGNVNKAIRRAGGSGDYWSVYNHLPRETRGYVPAFIAVNYIFNHAADHNLYPIIPNYCAYEVDTVQVCYPLDLGQVATLMGGSAQEIRDLNPTFKQGIVPDVQQPVAIYVPHHMVDEFIEFEDAIMYSYVPDMSTPAPNMPSSRSTTVSASTGGGGTKYHTVRRGESLGSIAQKHGTTVSQLRKLNNLKSDRIHAGQKLVVKRGTASATTASTPSAAPAPKAPSNAAPAVTASGDSTDKPVEYIYHVVQPGDTLWGIAQRYPGVTVDDIKRLNSDMNLRKLPVGRKLKVRVQG